MIEGQTVYLGLGSNLGRRLTHLRRAVLRLNETPGIRVDAVSPVYESEAHTKGSDDKLTEFLNMVVRIHSSRTPEALLDICLSIETAEGRHGKLGSWLPRTIDIDILAFGNYVLDSERLKVPHPRMAERRFVLLPFADLDPDFRVPEPFSATILELLNDCRDPLRIDRRYSRDAVFPAGGAPDEAK
ncbi:MAG TPA: 2-amino-4-hydroxy-6-hydroxymethyldihydropteridine diphosphokinase [Rhodothermales bacterium]|nr:2-amino-4-hydroxy-6-hydroxymethyldihydropteridine diphosphokinase [Rhodothermales bacterium]